VFDVARGAVARTYAVAVGLPRILAALLHGALDAEPLHVLVGGDFGVDVVSLNHERERHADDEQCDGGYREKQYYQPVSHNFFGVLMPLGRRHFELLLQIYTFVK